MSDPTFAGFFESWDLFRTAALSGAIAGALLGWLGVFVVLRRMVFFSAALSQIAGLGIALAYLTGLASPVIGATAATLTTTLFLASGRGGSGGQRERDTRRDALLGLFWLVGSAGTLAVGTRIVHEVQDIQSLLFGGAVVVLDEDFDLLLGLSLGLGALHLWWRRGFLAASFDADGSRVRGLPVRTLEVVLLVSMAVAISLCTRVLGALPVFAFSVLPAMAAVRLSRNVDTALFVGAVFGAVSGFGGYVLAYRFELPVGASQALLAAALVLVAGVIRRVSRWPVR